MESDCFLSESTVGAVVEEHNTTHLASTEPQVNKHHTHPHARTHAPNTITNLSVV